MGVMQPYSRLKVSSNSLTPILLSRRPPFWQPLRPVGEAREEDVLYAKIRETFDIYLGPFLYAQRDEFRHGECRTSLLADVALSNLVAYQFMMSTLIYRALTVSFVFYVFNL